MPTVRARHEVLKRSTLSKHPGGRPRRCQQLNRKIAHICRSPPEVEISSHTARRRADYLILWPSATARAEASASADRNRLRCRSVQQKIARKRAEKYAMPETCGSRDDMHGVARKCEQGMQACEYGGAWTGVPNRWAEENCACPACRSHAGDGGT